MTTQVKVEHKGGSHRVEVKVAGVNRAILHSAGDAWEGVVFKGANVEASEYEEPVERPAIAGLDDSDPDARLRNLKANAEAADANARACEVAAQQARQTANVAQAAYDKAAGKQQPPA